MTTQSTNPKDFTVAIVGGGICGLTCAIALTQIGVSVQIYEAAIDMRGGWRQGPNALKLLRSIGALDAVLEKAVETGPNSKPILFVSGMEGHEVIYDELSLNIHRAAVLDALIHQVDPKITHFKKRCTSVSVSPTDPSRTVIHFADGTNMTQIAVRSAVTQDGVDRVAFSNTVAYRGLIPHLTKRSYCIMGKDRILKSDVEVINLVAFATNHDIPVGSVSVPAKDSWVTTVSGAELVEEFGGWANDIIAFLRCEDKPSKWFIPIVHPPLESYVKGCIALIGDAAHAMLPHLGAGAGQCIEDAFLLAHLLGHPQTTASNVEHVLQTYDRVRRPRAQMVWEGARSAGRVYEFRGPHGSNMEGIREDLTGQWSPVWDHSMDEDILKAISWLKDSGVFVESS
ncbi:hypothetical protein B0H21DRAFT_776995 [Amylocystis lapponica]|nr:hypothetical protein B0H21DRAFT_776995 [Amylocystis lapponica]